MSNPYLLAKYVAFRLPTNLCIKSSCVSKGEYAVWSIDEIPLGTRFGPYEVKVPETSRNESEGLYWQMSGLFKEDWDERASNWLWLINYTCNEEQQNVIAIRHRSTVYYITSKCIPPNTELLVFCADEDVKKASLNRENAIVSIHNSPAERGYGQCSFEMRSDLEQESNNSSTEIVHQGLVRVDESSNYRSICHSSYCKLDPNKEHPNMRRDSDPVNNEHYIVRRHQSVDTPHLCDMCGRAFSRKSNLTRHKLVHSNERPYKCGECDKMFKRKQDLKGHQSIHIEERMCKSNICGKAFECSDPFNKDHPNMKRDSDPINDEHHTARRHQSFDTLHLCDTCGRAFSRKSNLKRHKLVHTNMRPYKCDKCDKMFKRKQDLKGHQCIHIEESMCKSTVCDKAFEYSDPINKGHPSIRRDRDPVNDEHYTARRHQSVDMLHLCEMCGRAFSRKSNLKRHKLVHTNVRPYKCDECDKMFKRKQDLKDHQSIHIEERTCKSNICGKAFEYSDPINKEHPNMKRDSDPINDEHYTERRHQSVDILHLCDMCGRAFSRKSNLKRHKLVHTNVRPYECDECDKMFKRKQDLKHHQSIHMEERKCKCNICGKAFKYGGCLRIHKTTHSKERPHKCKNCSRAFKTKNNLKRHEVLHIGVKPFVCKGCGRTFNRSDDLKKHELTHNTISNVAPV